jgi:hypothetical protein
MKSKQFLFEGSTSCPNEDVSEWLTANVGKYGLEWYHYASDLRGFSNPMNYYKFRTERSAILFLLRWA